MSQENVEIVRHALGHFLTTGEVAWDAFHEDIEVHDHDIPEAGDYLGNEGFIRWLQDWGAPWAEWTLEPEEWIDAGEVVVVIVNMKATGRGGGVKVERHDGLVNTVRDGKIARIDYFNSRKQALKAAGLSE